MKCEHHILAHKIPHPITLDDMRSLGLTRNISKGMEWILLVRIFPYIAPYIAIDQLGGEKGCSTTDYLAMLVQYIYEQIDGHGQGPTAVALMAIDYSKAFNRVNHSVLVTILHDINVPPCAIRLLVSYLQDRTMVVHYRGAESSPQNMPGGGPQGGILVGLLYNLYSNRTTGPCEPGVNLQTWQREWVMSQTKNSGDTREQKNDIKEN